MFAMQICKVIFAFYVLINLSTLARGQDVQGSQDHPLITRYPGQTITRYEAKEFDQYKLVLGVDRSGAPDKVQQLEGKITRFVYRNPAQRSTLEIFRNFEEGLKRAGAQILYTCAGTDCGTPIKWTLINGVRAMGGQKDNRYVTGKLTRAEAEVYVSIFIGSQATQLDVIEVKPIESGLVAVDADALGSDIERDGHAAVYAILFDTGKSIIKPESAAAIAEIAKLLKDRPRLNLYVVGHTDGTGGFEMNMKLSLDRAQAVVQSLVSGHGIAASRLKAQGVGPLAPVASNTTEEGKAKNRRVDLVAQ